MNVVDTNILVYAIDKAEPLKRPIALALLDQLTHQDTILLWHVLCEFTSVMARFELQGTLGLPIHGVVDVVRRRFPLVMPDAAVFDKAILFRQQRQIAFWDALLISACLSAGAAVLYTEDVPAAQDFGDLKFVNPFAS